MSNKLEKLKKLGAQKIHEDTHIALAHVQSIIHESFETFDKIQFLGFVSILEREYQIDLSSLREKGLAYFLEDEQEASLNTKIFLTPKKTYNFTWVYIIIAVIVFIIAVYYTTMQSKVDQEVSTLDNSAIENATSKIAPKFKIKENNVSLTSQDTIDSDDSIVDKNVTTQNDTIKQTTVPKPQEAENKVALKTEAKELIITPKSRVWIGYINATTKVKKQTVTSKKIVLDASKTWLLSFGHTHVKINIDKKSVKVPSSNKSMRFIYKDNELKQLNVTEFKKLNKGRIW